MVRRWRNESGKGLISSLFSLGLLVAVGVAAYMFIPQYQKDKAYINRLNGCVNMYNSQQWEQCAKAYEKLFSDYSAKEKSAAAMSNARSAYENWATEIYEQECLAKKTGWAACIQAYEKAAGYGPLAESYLMSLGDCYIETGQLDKAAGVVAEAAARDDVNAARFGLLTKRIAAAKK